MPDVSFEQVGDALIVRPTMKRLTALVAGEFRDVVLERVSSARVVVIALSAVEFVDSSGLAALISVIKRMPAGSRLALCNVNEAIRSVLTVMRLDKIFPVFESADAAIRGEVAAST